MKKNDNNSKLDQKGFFVDSFPIKFLHDTEQTRRKKWSSKFFEKLQYRAPNSDHFWLLTTHVTANALRSHFTLNISRRRCIEKVYNKSQSAFYMLPSLILSSRIWSAACWMRNDVFSFFFTSFAFIIVLFLLYAVIAFCSYFLSSIFVSFYFGTVSFCRLFSLIYAFFWFVYSILTFDSLAARIIFFFKYNLFINWTWIRIA